MPNKKNVFSFLSILGGMFLIFLIGFYIVAYNRAGDVVAQKIELPKEFEKEFSRVRVQNRLTPMPSVTFLSPEGKRVNWRDFRGKHVLVNFWATWCPPCVIELPSLGRLAKKFDGQDLSVIAVSIDAARDQSQIKQFLQNRGIGEFAAYHDDYSQVQPNIPMRGIPTSFLLNKKGQITHIFEGDARWDRPESYKFFDQIIAQ